MEIVSERRLGSYSPCHLSNEVTAKIAGLGFRIKSGCAIVVLLSGSIDSRELRDSRVIQLSDPRFPGTRQPYHAAMGKLETDTKKTSRRADRVHRIAKQSVAKMLADCRRRDFSISRACLVVGSQIDPATIGNPHIRAHALEGRLFRSAVEQALNKNGVHSFILLEREAYEKASMQFKKSSVDIRRTLQDLRRSTDRSWRADQKLAALAAWFALDFRKGNLTA